MSRVEFVQILTQAVMDKKITETQAKELVALYDAQGTPVTMTAVSLADLLAQQDGEDDRIRHLMMIFLLVLMGMGDTITPDRVVWEAMPQMIRGMPIARRTALMDMAQDMMDQELARLTERLGAGLALDEWMIQADTLVRRQMYLGHMLGAGALTAGIMDVSREMAKDSRYLAGFGGEIMLRQMLGKPMSGAWIAARLTTYGGAARALFYQGYETQGLPDGESGPGWVSEYEAEDDDHTCGRCHDAQGYYLPGEGPMPGRECLGGNKCRCRRVMIYAPDIYQELIAGG